MCGRRETQYIPSIEVPVLKGKYSEIKYKISNIDLSGFKLKSSDGAFWNRLTHS